MDNESRKPGRPLKGRTRRVPVTVYVPTDLLDAIDDYIEEKGGYTRSEFLCAGAEDRLRATVPKTYPNNPEPKMARII